MISFSHREISTARKRGGCFFPCSCVLVCGETSGEPTGGALGEISGVKGLFWVGFLSSDLEIR